MDEVVKSKNSRIELRGKQVVLAYSEFVQGSRTVLAVCPRVELVSKCSIRKNWLIQRLKSGL